MYFLPRHNSVPSEMKKGYTLLFAVLVSTIVLAIGVSILTIARKELLLTSAAHESEKSVYAADSGIECTYYNDVTLGKFPFPDDPTVRPADGTFFSIVCDDDNVVAISAVPVQYTDEVNDTTYWSYQYGPFSFGSTDITASPQCTEVTVTKRFQWNATVMLNVPVTVIESRGYNVAPTGVVSCTAPYPYKVERAIRIVY